jgi:putative ABC transport system permease protein
MIKEHLKSTLRFLKSNKAYVVNSLMSLTLGILSFLAIVIWVEREFSFDNFHQDKERIYRVTYNLYEESVLELNTASAVPAIGVKIREDISEMEVLTQMKLTEGIFKYQDTQFKESKVFYTDSYFFKVFSFKPIEGTIDNEILAINKAVITKSVAKKYFRNESAIGKNIRFNGDQNYYVTAVVDDIPDNSHFKFDILISMENHRKNHSWFINDWFGKGYYTYMKLKPHTDYKKVEKKLSNVVETYLGDFMKRADFLNEFLLQPLESIHLNSNLQHELGENGSLKMLSFLIIVAFMIIIISFINFLNLSIAKFYQRLKYYKIKKILGASKSQLITQFSLEIAVLFIIATLISLIGIIIIMPFYNNFMGSMIKLNFLSNFKIILGLFTAGMLVCFLIPSIYLFNQKRFNYLSEKAVINSGKSKFTKNLLIMLQFTASIILIIGTLVMNKQMKFMQSKDLGFDMEDMMIVETPIARGDSTYTYKLKLFKDILEQNQFTSKVCHTTEIPGKEIFWQTVMGKFISGENTEKKVDVVGIDKDFVDTYKLKVLAGRNFNESDKHGYSQVLINKVAVKYFEFSSNEDAIGKILCSGDRRLKIIGVVNDYNQRSLKELPRPTAYRKHRNNRYFSVKLPRRNKAKFENFAQNKWREIMNNNAIHIFQLDNFYNKQYKAESRYNRLFLIASLIVILIACSGLFSISLQAIQARTKEIGVRKVNGATILNILYLLNKRFTNIILVALIISMPIAYYVMNSWLETFSYRTSFGFDIFLISSISVLLIGIITVSWHALKHATQNPVEALRYE